MQTYIGKRSTGNDTTDTKDVHYLFFGVILFAGCHEQPPQDPDQVNPARLSQQISKVILACTSTYP